MKELKAREARALSEEDYELAEDLSREMEAISLDHDWTIATDSQSTVRIVAILAIRTHCRKQSRNHVHMY